jgi:ubiquitin-protein ligase E3 C
MPFKTLAQFLSATVLQNCAQCYDFKVRAKVFTHQLNLLKSESGYGWYQSGNLIKLRRDYMLEDAFHYIYEQKTNLHSSFRIQFIDQYDQVEDGIDGGGLMKEFMTKIS